MKLIKLTKDSNRRSIWINIDMIAYIEESTGGYTVVTLSVDNGIGTKTTKEVVEDAVTIANMVKNA